jgi:probable rRNA maturation factor
LDGEVVLSADTAAAAAGENGWTAADEQMLYVIHGMLHLVGYGDQSAAEAERMRAAEQLYLRQCGAAVPAAASASGEPREHVCSSSSKEGTTNP